MSDVMRAARAAMTAEEVAEFDAARAEHESVSAAIDARRAAPFADDAEYARQMAEISFLQLRRRHLRAVTSRMVDAAAGRAARAEVASIDGLLQPEAPAPEFDPKLQPLAGVRWPQGERRTPVEGEVALFDVTDPGELQDW